MNESEMTSVTVTAVLLLLHLTAPLSACQTGLHTPSRSIFTQNFFLRCNVAFSQGYVAEQIQQSTFFFRNTFFPPLIVTNFVLILEVKKKTKNKYMT